IKLDGVAKSSGTTCLETILYELHVPLEPINVDVSAGVHKTPAYLEIQLIRQVPYIV
ncbi:hypothetical protein B0H10DRAFT_1694911, partial [Mycena sp. CBHHK59/15]